MASTSRLLLLRRGDHDSRLTEGFESLLDMESMTDVSITCGQHIVKAHRTVLSIFSPFFKRVFDSIQNPIHYPFVVLKDMPYSDLKAIIDLMYRGEVTVAQDQFGSLKKSAKTLEVSELSDIISSYEEKNDIKPKLEDNNSQSGVRNTRKRGRPKRYCEDESDEEFKVFPATPTPPTKRQQVLQSNRMSNIVKKPFEPTIGPKVQTATRGGVNLGYSRPPTAIRGGHSAFQKPQTATRGGTIVGYKPQIATRGGPKSITRGRGGRYASQATDLDYTPQQDVVRRTSRRGRPPRTGSGNSRDSSDLPLATSLPVSLPEPIQVDLGNIFPNYNLNDVTSSTSNVSNYSSNSNSVAVTFEQTIKREPDSDSEVECIMSASSPLPSGVIEDIPELTETLQTSCNEVSTNSNSQTNEVTNNETNNGNNNEVMVEDSAPEGVTANETVVSPPVVESQSSALPPNIVIKTERRDSPINETEAQVWKPTQELAVSSGRRDSDNNDSVLTTTTTSQPEPLTESTPVSVTAPTIISLNAPKRDSNVPLIRFIKTERISPPPIVQSFQSIANSSTNQSEPNPIELNDESTGIAPEDSVETTIPVLTRVKIERISPNNNVIDIEDNEELSQTTTELTTSHNNDSTAETTVCPNPSTEEDSNEVQITHSIPTHTLRSIKVERQSPTPTEDVIQNSNNVFEPENTECTSSSGYGQQSSAENSQQRVESEDNAEVIDVQDIAFDCFYSNDDQQMQTMISETTATSSTSVITTSDVNSLLGLDTIQDISSNHQNNEISVGTSSHQLFALNPEEQQLSTNNASVGELQSSTNYSTMDANNVVMNSPIHSDEECMLLDSPQQTGYEVTIGSEPNNLDDSMDDNIF